MSPLSSNTLRVGDPAPLFALPRLDGGVGVLADAVDRGPVVVLFSPGAWSPATRRQLAELEVAHPVLRAMGVELFLVVSQDLKRLRRRLFDHLPPFPVLADEEKEAVRDYGVYSAFSLDGIGVSRPAAFVIERGGSVRFIFVGRDDREAPETDAIVNLVSWLIADQRDPELLVEEPGLEDLTPAPQVVGGEEAVGAEPPAEEQAAASTEPEPPEERATEGVAPAVSAAEEETVAVGEAPPKLAAERDGVVVGPTARPQALSPEEARPAAGRSRRRRARRPAPAESTSGLPAAAGEKDEEVST